MILITWLLPSMTMNGPAIFNSSLSSLGDVQFLRTVKVGVIRIPWTVYPTLKADSINSFALRYRLYFAYCLVKVFDTFLSIGATCCKILWLSTFWFVASVASSGGVARLRNIGDPDRHFGDLRMKAVLIVERWTWQLYKEGSGWTIMSQFCWLSENFSQS